MSYSFFCGVLAAGFSVIAVTAVWPQARAQGAGMVIPQATVHVQVFGCFGDEIPVKDLALFRFSSHDNNRDFVRHGRDLVITDVPFGYYDLLVADRSGGMAERSVTVNDKNVWVRIGLHFPFGDRLGPPGVLVIRGEIGAAKGHSDWWARVEGVFLNENRESPVSATGEFYVGGLDMGTYLVEVFEGSKLRHVETVEIDPNQAETHLTISIP